MQFPPLRQSLLRRNLADPISGSQGVVTPDRHTDMDIPGDFIEGSSTGGKRKVAPNAEGEAHEEGELNENPVGNGESRLVKRRRRA